MNETKLMKIETASKPGVYNPRTKRTITKESYYKTINSDSVQERLKTGTLYIIPSLSIKTIGDFVTVDPNEIIGIVKEIHEEYIMVEIKDQSKYDKIVQPMNDFSKPLKGRIEGKLVAGMNALGNVKIEGDKVMVTDISVLSSFSLLIYYTRNLSKDKK